MTLGHSQKGRIMHFFPICAINEGVRDIWRWSGSCDGEYSYVSKLGIMRGVSEHSYRLDSLIMDRLYKIPFDSAVPAQRYVG